MEGKKQRSSIPTSNTCCRSHGIPIRATRAPKTALPPDRRRRTPLPLIHRRCRTPLPPVPLHAATTATYRRCLTPLPLRPRQPLSTQVFPRRSTSPLPPPYHCPSLALRPASSSSFSLPLFYLSVSYPFLLPYRPPPPSPLTLPLRLPLPSPSPRGTAYLV